MTADTKPEAEALLPCPFCGGKAEIVTGPIAERFGGRCTSCGVWRDDRATSKLGAAYAWNTRAAHSKPVEVAPDDEAAAHLYSIEKLCNEVALTMNGGRVYLIGEARQAIEALRRHIAGLRARIDRDEAAITDLTIRTNSAEAALKACRAATIEECAACAEDFDVRPTGSYATRTYIATAIRALKTQEPTNG